MKHITNETKEEQMEKESESMYIELRGLYHKILLTHMDSNTMPLITN